MPITEGTIAQAPRLSKPDDAAATVEDLTIEPPLSDVIAEVAARQPDHVAVDDGTSRLTYGELCDRALLLGARIAASVPDDGLVGVLVPTTALYPIAWFACLAARRAFLPLDPSAPPARIQAIVAESRLAAMLVPTQTDSPDWLPGSLPRIAMAEPHPEPPPLPRFLPSALIGSVLFTSGSTGRPKGIALHERSLLRKAMGFRSFCGLGPNDRLLSLNPPSSAAGASDTFGALVSGATLFPADLKRDGFGRASALLRSEGITVCAAIPAVERAFLASHGSGGAFRHLRVLRLNSDAVTGSDVAALAPHLAPTARILLRFGMTESGTTLAQRLIDPHASVEAGRLAVGVPLPDQRLSIEDAHGDPVAPGVPGELVVRGRYVALGHWVAGRLDATAFPSDPADPDSRCYRTGDMVVLRPDGMLLTVGRADRLVKINGMRVEPGETEGALRSLPGVADAAVLVEGDAKAPTLVAFVALSAGHQAAAPSARLARAWRSALAGLLPPQQVPARIHVVPAIPLLPSLKPDLAALRALSATSPPGMRARLWTRFRSGQ